MFNPSVTRLRYVSTLVLCLSCFDPNTHSYAAGTFVHQYCLLFGRERKCCQQLQITWFCFLWFCSVGSDATQKLSVDFNLTATRLRLIMVVHPYYVCLFWIDYFIRPSATLLGYLYISTIVVLVVNAHAITAPR